MPDDNEAILAFMRKESIEAGLSFRFERAPDFFALPAAHSPQHSTWLVMREDRIVSIASVIVRPAYVDRKLTTVAYVGDLRQGRDRGAVGVWRVVAPAVLESIRREFAPALAYFSLLRDNRLARSSIVGSALGRRLGIQHFRGYRTVSVVGRLPWPRRRRFEIRRARGDDSEALRVFIDAQCRDLQLAPVFDRETWRQRLTDWPDFAIDSFLLAVDWQGAVVGCVAPWDCSRINRIVIDSLPRGAEALRRAINAASVVTRRPRIETGPSSHLPDLKLTHVFIKDRDPDIFAALLGVAFRALVDSRRYATLTFGLYDDDPLWGAVKGLIRTTVPMDVYVVPVGDDVGSSPEDRLWPGFESYLV